MRRVATFFFLWLGFAAIILGMFVATFWYWEVRRAPVVITLATSELSGPRDALIVHFSQTVQPRSLDGKLHIEPAQTLRTEWHDHNRTLVLLPEENWPLDSHHQLTLGSGKTSWFGPTPQTVFRFDGPTYPSITEIYPGEQAKDVLVGIEDPLRVTFDRSVKDFFIDFRMDPMTEVVYQHNPEKTQFEILPKTPLPAGKSHTLSIYAKWRGEPDQNYTLLKTTTFTTLPPAPKYANQDLTLRAEEAKRFTQPRKIEGKYIDINIKNQVMTLFENGKALEAYIISSGKPGMDTPRGEFAIRNKAERPWSKRYSLYMPFWQAITPDGLFGIHELPEWPGGYKEGANHLGTPVSHGCVRLGLGAAERVYTWTEIGTPIVIY